MARNPSPHPSSSDRIHLDSLRNKIQLLQDRVLGVAERLYTGCYIVGRPGTSKTYSVIQKLESIGKPFRVQNARMTAAGLFELLADFPDQTLVLDDIPALWADKLACTILMPALDGEPKKPRTVTYRTRDRNESVEFRGGIIGISNLPLTDDPLANAVASRVVLVEHEPTDAEIAAMMRDLARKGFRGRLKPRDCLKVVEFLIAESMGIDRRLDLRYLTKAWTDFLQWKMGQAKTHWTDLIRTNLKKSLSGGPAILSKEQEIRKQRRQVKELLAKHPDDTERQIAESGLRKSTFYIRRKEVLSGY